MFGLSSVRSRSALISLLGLSFVVLALAVVLYVDSVSQASFSHLPLAQAADSSAVFVRDSKCWKSCSFEDEVLNKLDLILGELNVVTAKLNKVKK